VFHPAEKAAEIDFNPKPWKSRGMVFPNIVLALRLISQCSVRELIGIYLSRAAKNAI
jgi:hypothetical protein